MFALAKIIFASILFSERSDKKRILNGKVSRLQESNQGPLSHEPTMRPLDDHHNGPSYTLSLGHRAQAKARATSIPEVTTYFQVEWLFSFSQISMKIPRAAPGGNELAKRNRFGLRVGTSWYE